MSAAWLLAAPRLNTAIATISSAASRSTWVIVTKSNHALYSPGMYFTKSVPSSAQNVLDSVARRATPRRHGNSFEIPSRRSLRRVRILPGAPDISHRLR
jgi:hypothetical protein